MTDTPMPPSTDPTGNESVVINREVREKQHRLDRLDNMERWFKLGGILATLLLVVFLLVAAIWQGDKINNLTNGNKRLDCIGHVEAAFFGHLADALSKEPASTQRQMFLDQMKSDAAKLNFLEKVCM